MVHTFVFWAENQTDPFLFTDSLKIFYKDFLGDDVDNIDPIVLENLLASMEVLVDVNDYRAILIYQSNILQ